MAITPSPLGPVTIDTDQSYVGRFAPSPTGPLHLGSLVSALASALDARAGDGKWIVRIEDLDRERNVAGAAEGMLRTLERFGFEWHGPVMYQSRETDRYQSAFETLERNGHVFPCACSRKEISNAMNDGVGDPVYPGTCRAGVPAGRPVRSYRLRVPARTICFDDRNFGRRCQALDTEAGDFVLKREAGDWTYQLAVVVDDAYQGVNHVVRGVDLIDSTPRQILLQELLGLPTPRYYHLPLVLGEDGQKLSKQTGAAALEDDRVLFNLERAAQFLRLPLKHCADLADFWQQATWLWKQRPIDATTRTNLD